MIHRSHRAGLSLEPPHEGGRTVEASVEHLQGDFAAHLRIEGEVDLRHGADPKDGAELVASDAVSRDRGASRHAWIYAVGSETRHEPLG